MENWHYAAIGGSARGPLSKNDLGSVLRAELGASEFLVWRPGMPDWARAGDVPALSEFLHKPPPTPTVSNSRCLNNDVSSVARAQSTIGPQSTASEHATRGNQSASPWKSLGGFVLAIGLMVGMLALAGGIINGVAWVSENFLGYLINGTNILTAGCLFILLPLGMFRATRIFAASGLMACSYVFGATVWLYGFLVTYTIWGWFGILAGLVLGIVGIVPLGMIAAGLNSHWWFVGELAYGVVLTYLARFVAVWLIAKAEIAKIDAELAL